MISCCLEENCSQHQDDKCPCEHYTGSCDHQLSNFGCELKGLCHFLFIFDCPIAVVDGMTLREHKIINEI